MALRRLTIMMLCIWACATPLAQAALVAPADGTYLRASPPGAAPRADLDAFFHATALLPGDRGDALCADRSLCQEADDRFGAPLQPRSAPSFDLLGRPTLIANAALLGIGLLWMVVTRRSLRVAATKARQG